MQPHRKSVVFNRPELSRISSFAYSLLKTMATRLRWPKPWHTLDLLRELIIRDIKLMYNRSVLGIAWSLINPLLQLAIFTFLFRHVLSTRISRFSLFTFCGILAWTWFQTSLIRGAAVIVESRELLRQPGFPAAALPVVAVGTNFINFLISMSILMVVLLLEGTAPKAAFLAVPFIIAVQFVLTLSFVYFFAALNVIFRDTQHILGVLLQLYFFMTPIFYDVTSIPEHYRTLYMLNPLARLLGAYRTSLMLGEAPDWLPLLIIGLLSATLMTFSLSFFRRTSKRFVEEL
jgi:lipopolysaccharide transport system permease protein